MSFSLGRSKRGFSIIKKSGVKKAPPTAKKPPKKNGFDKEKAKENDWYYQRKLFEKELDLKQK